MEFMNKTIYLGIDPGKLNFACAGLDKSGKLTYATMLHDTIWSTAQENASLRRKYRVAIWRILRRLRPTAVMCESFVVRGFGTNLIELVNLMIGSLQMACAIHHIDEHMVMPSSWKGAFNKVADLAAEYDFAAKKRVPPHILDAICLATYLKMNKTFKGLDLKLLRANVTMAAKILKPTDLLPIKKAKKKRAARK
jgi:hypothetical protein